MLAQFVACVRDNKVPPVICRRNIDLIKKVEQENQNMQRILDFAERYSDVYQDKRRTKEHKTHFERTNNTSKESKPESRVDSPNSTNKLSPAQTPINETNDEDVIEKYAFDLSNINEIMKNYNSHKTMNNPVENGKRKSSINPLIERILRPPSSTVKGGVTCQNAVVKKEKAEPTLLQKLMENIKLNVESIAYMQQQQQQQSENNIRDSTPEINFGHKSNTFEQDQVSNQRIECTSPSLGQSTSSVHNASSNSPMANILKSLKEKIISNGNPTFNSVESKFENKTDLEEREVWFDNDETPNPKQSDLVTNTFENERRNYDLNSDDDWEDYYEDKPHDSSTGSQNWYSHVSKVTAKDNTTDEKVDHKELRTLYIEESVKESESDTSSTYHKHNSKDMTSINSQSQNKHKQYQRSKSPHSRSYHKNNKSNGYTTYRASTSSGYSHNSNYKRRSYNPHTYEERSRRKSNRYAMKEYSSTENYHHNDFQKSDESRHNNDHYSQENKRTSRHNNNQYAHDNKHTFRNGYDNNKFVDENTSTSSRSSTSRYDNN